MLIRLKLFSLLLFTVLLGFIFPHNAYADTFTLSGHVTNSNGENISNASIEVIDITSNANIANTITDVQGNYNIIIPNGNYNIEVTPPPGSNFSPAIALSQNISNNTSLNFILTPAGTVSLKGHVYDSQGNPVSGQRVQLFTNDFNNLVSQDTTDIDGKYSMEVSSGTYDIKVVGTTPNGSNLSMPQAYNLSVNSYSLTKSTELEITIPAKKVSIHVQDVAGNPISNVQLSTTAASSFGGLPIGGGLLGGGTSKYDQGPLTNANGDAELWLIPNSNVPFTIIATPPGNTNYKVFNLTGVSITTDTNKTIILPESVTLKGYIYDPQGNPVSGQRVQLFTNDFNNLVTQDTTDSNGKYILNVSAGTYDLKVVGGTSLGYSPSLPPNYNISSGGYSITNNTDLNITIPVKRVNIHVQDVFGNPVSNVGLTTTTAYSIGGILLADGLYGGGASRYDQGPSTNTSGDAILWLMPNNSVPYTITATPPGDSGYKSFNLTGVAISGDSNETIILPKTVTFKGHIYDALGNPASDQQVQLFTNDFNNLVAQTTTNLQGEYSIDVSAGTYNFKIVGGASVGSNLALPQAYNISSSGYILANTNDLNINIPAKKVSIHVQDSFGNPVENVQLTTNVASSYGGLPIGDGLTGAGSSKYDQGPLTNASGDADLWLIPNSNTPFTIFATPIGNSVYKTFALQNILINSDTSELISLQYNHATPVTTADLVTQHNNGTYSDPTTVTLSATPANGYTIANTYYTIDSGAQQTYNAPFTVTGDGSHTIVYWSTDNSGVQEAHNTKSFTIHVNQAPYVNPLNGASIPSGGTYNETGSFTDTDSSSWTATVDYDDGAGDQPLSLNPDKSFSLSHQYASANTYHVKVVVTDDQFGTGTTFGSVVVVAPTPTPTNTPTPLPTATPTPANVAPVINTITSSVSTVQVQNSVTMNASFTDANQNDTHTALWNWGDGTTSTGTITEANGTGTVTKSHTYTTSGVYTVTLTVTDNHASSDATDYQYVTVYDPSNGWSTGDKQYTSPQGAVIGNQSATGTADFGFTAKYVNGVLQPVGNKWASVNFDAGNIDFTASNYQSLVITNGTKIILRGTGTLNGVSGYSVLISAIDGGNQGTSYIRYQIKNGSGNIVYDTQPGAADTANPTTPVSHGKIQIH